MAVSISTWPWPWNSIPHQPFGLDSLPNLHASDPATTSVTLSCLLFVVSYCFFLPSISAFFFHKTRYLHRSFLFSLALFRILSRTQQNLRHACCSFSSDCSSFKPAAGEGFDHDNPFGERSFKLRVDGSLEALCAHCLTAFSCFS